MRRLAAALATVLIACAAAGSAAAAERISLDPFRPDRAATDRAVSGQGSGASALLPFRRVAQATPPAAEQTVTPTPTPTPTGAAPGTTTPVTATKTCQVDDDCPAENFCGEQGICEVIQTRTNILYLYYREGSFREILGLYWSKSGPSGYKVVAPIYWHYWSAKSRTRIVAPFYWHHEDFAARYTSTVIVPGLPISWSSQPDASSFGVWPLFYRSTKFGWAAPLLGSFKIADPDHHSSYGSLLFLYWWKRSPTRDRDFAFPVFYSTRSPSSAFTYAVPLSFYWRNKDDKNLLVLPLLYWNQHKEGGSLYSIIGYHTREGDENAGALLWLYWFGGNRNDHTGYDIFFPLVWSFHSPTSNTTVAGPVFHLRRQSWHFTTVFPLWWSGGDTAKGQGFRTLLPFFYWERSEHDRRSMWVTPIGGYSRDDVEGSRTMLLLPLIFTRRDRTSALHVITPAYIRYRDSESGSTTSLIGALLYLRRDPAGSTSALFPLFWRFRDAASGSTATALLPFFARRVSPSETSTYAGFLLAWGYKRTFNGVGGGEAGWSAGLFPLAFFGERGDSSHGVVFPLYWHFRTGQQSTTVALPLFYQQRSKHAAGAGIPLLLAFWGHNDRSQRYTVQFPFYWHFADDREGWSTTATPLGYYHTDRQGWSAGVLPPIFFVGGGAEKSHLVIFPLFWRFENQAAQKTTTVVLNYFHRSHGGETTDCFFPLIYYRRGARPGGSDETSFTLFPFVHYRRDPESNIIATLLGASWHKGERAAGFIGPYLWYRGSNFDAKGVPFIYVDVTNRALGERTRQIGPWFAIDGPGRQSRLLFPFYGSYDDAQEHDTYVFPTYFRLRKTDGYALDTFFPFYWHSHIGARSTTVIGPWYQHRDGGVHDTGVAPLYFYAKNDQRSVLVVPPALLYHRADFKAGTERTLAALLYYHTGDPDAHTTVLFPFWWSGHDKQRSHQILFPLYWHIADQENHTALTFAGPVFWSTKGTSRTRGLLPIAWSSDDSATGASSHAFLPFFYQGSGPHHFRLFTLVGGYSKSETSRAWYALILASGDSIERRFRMIFPLWFSYDNKGTEAKTRIVPPVLFYSRTTPETKLTTVLALFWHHRDIAASMTLGLPLYYDFDDFHESRTTVFVPLFVRHHREVDDTTYIVAPLFYRRSTPGDSTTIAFPLFWDFRKGNESTTILAPFYGHWRRPTYAATYVFPTYYYREGLGPKGPDGTYRRMLVPFFETAVKRRGDYMWEVLGGLFGHERVGRNQYLKLFFMTFETEAPAHTQTAWYGKPIRASRREATRGLSANVW